MDVDHAVMPGVDESAPEDAHEAGEADELDACLLERAVERRVEGVTIGEVAVSNDPRRDLGARRALEALSIGAIGNHQDDLGRIVAHRARVDQRLKVGAAAGDQHAGPQPGHARSVLTRWALASPAPLTMWPIQWTRSPAWVRTRATASTCAGATTATMPMPQLNVRAISARAMPAVCVSQAKTGGSVQVAASISAARPSGSTRGMFSTKPPPVICA